MKLDFPLYTLKKLAKRNGVKRISSKALEEVEDFLLELTEKISKASSVYASHAKRLTIKPEDVKLAIKGE